MKVNVGLIVAVLAVPALFGCTSSAGGLSKDEARSLLAEGMLDTDPCAREGWYGDGECDAFCPSPDPDCVPTECVADTDCASGQRCVPGDFCYTWCAAGDPSCCLGNVCQAVEATTPESDCTLDTDCADGEVCVAGDLCYHWCEAGDPTCCRDNRCEARPEPPADNECTQDAD